MSSGKLNEAPFWTLFSGGGVMAAMFIPAFILVTGFMLPTTDEAAAVERYAHIKGWLDYTLVKLIVLGIVFLAFFHAAHRIKHTAVDLGLRSLAAVIMPVCYLGALAVGVWAAVVLFSF